MKREENRDPALCRAFVEAATAALASVPQVKYELSQDVKKHRCVLSIPKTDADGFDIAFEVHPQEIIVLAGGVKTFIPPESTDQETIQEALGLLRDLLTPHMRIREQLASGKPYKWYLESLSDGGWAIEQTDGLIFYAYWGKRSERIYQNRVLEGRLNND